MNSRKAGVGPSNGINTRTCFGGGEAAGRAGAENKMISSNAAACLRQRCKDHPWLPGATLLDDAINTESVWRPPTPYRIPIIPETTKMRRDAAHSRNKQKAMSWDPLAAADESVAQGGLNDPPAGPQQLATCPTVTRSPRGRGASLPVVPMAEIFEIGLRLRHGFRRLGVPHEIQQWSGRWKAPFPVPHAWL